MLGKHFGMKGEKEQHARNYQAQAVTFLGTWRAGFEERRTQDPALEGEKRAWQGSNRMA